MSACRWLSVACLMSVLALLAPTCAQAWALPVRGPPMQPASDIEWRAFQSFGSAEGLPQNSVLALLQDADGFILAGTQDGLARYDGRHWRVIELPTGGRRYAVGALALATDASVWIGTDTQGAWRLARGRSERVALDANDDDSSGINAFWAAPDGAVWVATQAGLQRCRPASCTRINALAGLGARSLLAETVDGEQRLWVGSNRAGILQLRDLDAAQPVSVGASIDRRAGLPNNVGLALARFAGDLWIGTGRGLARFDGKRLHVYSADNGFPVAMVFALQASQDADGQPQLLATLRPGGLAEIAVDGSWRLLDGRNGLPANATHALLRERYRGLLWVGTMTAGVARLERERWALFDERSGLPDRLTLGVGWSDADGGTLWVGTAGGPVRWQSGRFVPLLGATEAPLLVYDLLDAPDGDRWIAHARGLQRWRGGVLAADYTVDNSPLPAVSVDQLALRRSADGFEVYAASGHGLARWRLREGLRRVDDVPELAGDESIRSMSTLPDPQMPDHDQLWLASSAGLLRIDDRGAERLNADCLRDTAPLVVAAEPAPGGALLWLGTRDGLLQLHADGRCTAWPAAAALGAVSHLQPLGEHLYAFGARGVLRLQRDGAADQAGTLFGNSAGLGDGEITDSAVDARGRLFAASASGLAAFDPNLPPATRDRAPLRLLSATYDESRQSLHPGQTLPASAGSVHFEYALLAFEREHEVRYRVQLEGLQSEFGAWTTRADASFPRLPAGQFTLVVEARDADGQRAQPIRFAFSVDRAWWQQPWAIAGAALCLLAFGLTLGRWRLHAAQRRASELADEVATRTRELAHANALLEEAAVTDPLTGLKNRRFFALAAPAEAERARRAGPAGSLLLALLDIDHFKRINDSHGHDTGDAVLIEVARRLERVARGGDFVLRWGGEEFLLLLRDVPADAADTLLRRLLQALADNAVETGDLRLPVSASIGAVGFPLPPSVGPGGSLEQAISLADEALYRAKHAGRNRAMRVLSVGVDGTLECAEVLV
jgi:diguanylate cyclase (GGDEF)-like protein